MTTYVYLCDSIDKVEYFRSIHRELARHCLNVEALESITEDSEDTEWEFYENVFVIEGKMEQKVREARLPRTLLLLLSAEVRMMPVTRTWMKIHKNNLLYNDIPLVEFIRTDISHLNV